MANYEYIIGIDVGTSSVRGALVDTKGKVCKIRVSSIKTWNPASDFYQQSSNDIWRACCDVIKNLTTGISPLAIKGIGFDATCSLAVFDVNGQPISVEPNGDNEQNIILWMDHRARKETEFINETKHPLLRYVGGTISIEMVVPKLLWLKRNNKECWNRARRYFLLSDFLTWKCTEVEDRSLCSVVCKCNYENKPGSRSGWNRNFFDTLQLGELFENNWEKLGSKIINPGNLVGGLTMQASIELNLTPGLPIGASLIDAHAGGLGIMGCTAPNLSPKYETRLGLICGTSTCHMIQTRDKLFVPGMWGPFYSAILPGMWLLTGGQSASGALIDHIIAIHPATASIKAKIKDGRITTYLNNILNAIRNKNNVSSIDELTDHIHVWPDFHGNRSPLADPGLRGMILGLSLKKDEENLALLYLATMQALAYGTKYILNAIESSAGKQMVESVVLCGGLSQNKQFVQTYANVLGLPVLVTEGQESMLLGAAQLGATAAGIYHNLQESMLNMGGLAKQIKPHEGILSFHVKKYEVFLELLSTQYKCRDIMNK